MNRKLYEPQGAVNDSGKIGDHRQCGERHDSRSTRDEDEAWASMLRDVIAHAASVLQCRWRFDSSVRNLGVADDAHRALAHHAAADRWRQRLDLYGEATRMMIPAACFMARLGERARLASIQSAAARIEIDSIVTLACTRRNTEGFDVGGALELRATLLESIAPENAQSHDELSGVRSSIVRAFDDRVRELTDAGPRGDDPVLCLAKEIVTSFRAAAAIEVSEGLVRVDAVSGRIKPISIAVISLLRNASASDPEVRRALVGVAHHVAMFEAAVQLGLGPSARPTETYENLADEFAIRWGHVAEDVDLFSDANVEACAESLTRKAIRALGHDPGKLTTVERQRKSRAHKTAVASARLDRERKAKQRRVG